MPVLQLIREVTRLYARQQRQTVGACAGTSLTHCSILTELGRSGPLSLMDLTKAIGFDKSWTSRTVDALAADGLVARSADRQDGRKIALSLTAKGRARFERLNAALDDHARSLLRRIPPAERMAVQRALALLHDALTSEAEDAAEDACAG